MEVPTVLCMQECEDARPYYVAITCPACMRLHFIDKSTGKALGQHD